MFDCFSTKMNSDLPLGFQWTTEPANTVPWFSHYTLVTRNLPIPFSCKSISHLLGLIKSVVDFNSLCLCRDKQTWRQTLWPWEEDIKQKLPFCSEFQKKNWHIEPDGNVAANHLFSITTPLNKHQVSFIVKSWQTLKNCASVKSVSAASETTVFNWEIVHLWL